MATFKRFEDISAWQKARDLTRETYKVSAVGAFSKDFGLRDQLRRASISMMANISEGFDRGGTREFIQFLSTAKGSASEIKSHCTLLWIKGTLTRPTLHTCMRWRMRSARC